MHIMHSLKDLVFYGLIIATTQNYSNYIFPLMHNKCINCWFLCFSPTIVDETSDPKLVARRVLWGKLSNAGQTCIAPDYLLCAESIQVNI